MVKYLNIQNNAMYTQYCTSQLKGVLWGDWEDSDTLIGHGDWEGLLSTPPLFPCQTHKYSTITQH